MYKQFPEKAFLRIAVTNREIYCSSHGVCSLEEYAYFLAGIAAGKEECLKNRKRPDMMIVREKDLSEAEYCRLFASVWEKTRGEDCRRTLVVPHGYLAAARLTESGWIHLPFPLFQKSYEKGMLLGMNAGTSVHSVKEAEIACKMGACYVTAGHIFATDCKKGTPPRGLDFLKQICDSVSVAVYAIGGIHETQIPLIRKTEAFGACMMSEYMA